MDSRPNQVLAFLRSEWSAPLAMLAVCVAAYGLWLPHLGFYWDAWPMNWIAQTLGGEGLARYFSTNRPVWGVLYQITTPLLGGAPLPWQLSALVLRWLTGVAVWLLVRLVWPGQKSTALATSLLFLAYPGFQQQSIGLLYTHFFLVLNAFLFSLVCTLAALRQPGRYRLLTAGAVILSLVNLLSMEYFFMLELLRPLLIWLVLGETLPWRRRWLPALRSWLPYLVIFLGAGFWRAFLFPYTQNNYQMVLVEQLKVQPGLTLFKLGEKAITQVWIAFGDAWKGAVTLPFKGERDLSSGYWLVVALSAFGLLAWLSAQKTIGDTDKRPGKGGGIFVAGGLALLLAGWPFWLTNVPFLIQFANDRFTLPFMLGVSLVLWGMLKLLPGGRWVSHTLLAGLVGLAIGLQYEAGYAFTQDWTAQKNFFWQLTWRAPAIQPGTLIISNEARSMPYSTDNSLTAPLNWIYRPTVDNLQSSQTPHPDKLAFMLFYPSIRLGVVIPKLEKGQEVTIDYLVASYSGSTDQAIAIYYNPPGCLRVLEAVDGNDTVLFGMERQAAIISRPELIIADPPVSARPMPIIFGEEPAHDWCYTFQKAMLARQQQDWARVLALGVEADRLGLHYKLPSELLPFIEAEARTGNWTRAQQLTLEAGVEHTDPRGRLCYLWGKLLKETPQSGGRSAAWADVQVKLECDQ